MTKEELQKELKVSFNRVIDWLEAQDNNAFELGPESKWTTSQQLDHLHRATKAINNGMKVPKIMLRWKFGLANRPSRTFQDLDRKYKAKIANLPKDFKQPAPPRLFNNADKNDRLNKYRAVANVMIGNAEKWTEKNLDKYIMPHPAVGKITMREFLMWTIIHNEHHLKSLQDHY